MKNKTIDDRLAASKTMLLLSRSEMEGLVTMAQVIEAVEAAHADMANGTAIQPAAVAMSLPTGSATFLAMPAFE